MFDHFVILALKGIKFGRFNTFINYIQSKMKSLAKVVNLKSNIFVASTD